MGARESFAWLELFFFSKSWFFVGLWEGKYHGTFLG